MSVFVSNLEKKSHAFLTSQILIKSSFSGYKSAFTTNLDLALGFQRVLAWFCHLHAKLQPLDSRHRTTTPFYLKKPAMHCGKSSEKPRGIGPILAIFRELLSEKPLGIPTKIWRLLCSLIDTTSKKGWGRSENYP